MRVIIFSEGDHILGYFGFVCEGDCILRCFGRLREVYCAFGYCRCLCEGDCTPGYFGCLCEGDYTLGYFGCLCEGDCTLGYFGVVPVQKRLVVARYFYFDSFGDLVGKGAELKRMFACHDVMFFSVLCGLGSFPLCDAARADGTGGRQGRAA